MRVHGNDGSKSIDSELGHGVVDIGDVSGYFTKYKIGYSRACKKTVDKNLCFVIVEKQGRNTQPGHGNRVGCLRCRHGYRPVKISQAGTVLPQPGKNA